MHRFRFWIGLLLAASVLPEMQAQMSLQLGYNVGRHINLQRDWQTIAGAFNNTATNVEVLQRMRANPAMHGLSIGFGGHEENWGFSMLLITRHGRMVGRAINSSGQETYTAYRMRQNAFTIGMHYGLPKLKIGLRYEMGGTGTHVKTDEEGSYERIKGAPFTVTLVPYLCIDSPIGESAFLSIRPYVRPNWALTPFLSPIVDQGSVGSQSFYRTGIFGINFLISIPLE